MEIRLATNSGKAIAILNGLELPELVLVQIVANTKNANPDRLKIFGFSKEDTELVVALDMENNTATVTGHYAVVLDMISAIAIVVSAEENERTDKSKDAP